tara:strand:- start:3244 stop:5445 length:2202 start_codon:yes stop_codon:yes gene_type:complete
MCRFFIKNKFIIVVVFTILGCSNKKDQFTMNSYIHDFYVSKAYYLDQEKKVEPIELLEVNFIQNEEQFTNNVSDGQWIRSENGEHNINSAVEDSSYATVYLYKKIKISRPQKAYFLLSVTDGAKVYVNQRPVAVHFGYNYNGEAKLIPFDLRKGSNNIVIKTINKDWDWKIKCKILDKKHGQTLITKRNESQEFNDFLSIKLKPANYRHTYTSRVGTFPRLIVDKPGLAREYLGGNYSIKVKWFDAQANEVFYPKIEGRYGFYAEIIGANGTILKKGGTLFFLHNDRMVWNNRLEVSPEYFPIGDITKEIWKEHKEAISFYMGHITLESIFQQENANLLLSFLHEMGKHKYKKDKKLTPLILNGDYHAQIKQKVLGKEDVYADLASPKDIYSKPQFLKDEQKSFQRNNPTFTKELRKICEDWIRDDGSPFDMILARDGNILFHDAFGEDDYGKFTIKTPTEIASITKLFTGILFAQFVDQNIIGIDDPVGKYLPDFPLKGPRAVTMRHCFTHTSGLEGHGLFDGVHNPWLENTLFQTIKNKTAGTRYNYNGMGHDLAGKVMEVVSGKSVFRLFYEYLYEPLGMENTYHTWDLGYSVHSTAYDLSLLAQMVLNKGSYGGKQYFSEETYEKILPKDLKHYFPNITYFNDWDRGRPIGIGTTIQEWKVKDEETGEDRYMLSKNVIGHGSATSSQLRIDLDNNIIITQTRRRGKSRFGPNFEKLYKHIDNYLVRGVN